MLKEDFLSFNDGILRGQIRGSNWSVFQPTFQAQFF